MLNADLLLLDARRGLRHVLVTLTHEMIVSFLAFFFFFFDLERWILDVVPGANHWRFGVACFFDCYEWDWEG